MRRRGETVILLRDKNAQPIKGRREAAFRSTCEVGNCRRSTKDSREFCATHVLRQPYALEIEARMAERAAEIKKVRAASIKGWKLVDVEGLAAQELLALIEVNRFVSVCSLDRSCQFGFDITLAYVHALVDAGLAVLEYTRRGVGMVMSTEAAEGMRE